jgi:hypothetical protein
MTFPSWPLGVLRCRGVDHPLRNSWPFLLIVRTGRIVTVHGHAMNEYRRILGVSSIWPASLYEITLARGISLGTTPGDIP